eukprot:COSAG02_NODE_407_length_22898_cov_135.264047_12_plen_90_part_00
MLARLRTHAAAAARAAAPRPALARARAALRTYAAAGDGERGARDGTARCVNKGGKDDEEIATIHLHQDSEKRAHGRGCSSCGAHVSAHG